MRRPLTAVEAAAERAAAARAWGVTPSSIVVSQLGYPPIPEAAPRVAGKGGWIPRSVPVELVAHPVWWLEDSARLRRQGEDDDDYAGRLYWDLLGRGLIDEDGQAADVLWNMVQVDVRDVDGRQRVLDWLAGGEDRKLGRLWVEESPSGLRWAEREAALARPELENRLAELVAEDLEVISARAVDAARRFQGSTPEGVVEPLADAIKTFLGSGDVADRAAVGEAAQEVQDSVQAACGFVVVLHETLGEVPPAGMGGPAWEGLLRERVGWFYRSPSSETATALYTEAFEQARTVCGAGLRVAERVEGWRPVAPHRNRTATVTARFAEDVYGPPPVRLSKAALMKAGRQ